MTVRIDRRSLLMTGTLGLGAFSVPGFAQQANVMTARGFTHSVASGEPGHTSVLCWTRYVPASGDSVKLRLQISINSEFTRPLDKGEIVTGPWRDWTAKVVADNLSVGQTYFYRFVAPDGSYSPVGRTRTLPQGATGEFVMAVFSCSNLPYGHFNAYGHAADRDDIHLTVHLGDYFYEYEKGGYAPAAGAVDGRWPLPDGEIVSLADYRLRYASYRADPQLQRLHAMKPMIVSWDDHESTNDSWEGGAQNHQPNEGEWSIRKAAAVQAWREWMPVSDEPYKAYQIGTLATLYRTETRLFARSRPPEVARLFMEADPVAALTRYRDGAWQDPAATMMGWSQEQWLADAMKASVRAGTNWQVVGFGTIMGETRAPESAPQWLRPDAPARNKAYARAGALAGKVGLPLNFDNWGGYPAARRRFLESAQEANANLIVISGDSHNAWAYDLQHRRKPAGVEFAGQSVTSPGYEASLGIDPRTAAAELVRMNSELKWCDLSNRGYMALTLLPNMARNEWVFVDTVQRESKNATIGHSARVSIGRNEMRD